jgi:hypothetical protein
MGALPFRNDVQMFHVVAERPLLFQHCDIVFRRRNEYTKWDWAIDIGRTPSGRSAWDRLDWGRYDVVFRLAPGTTGQERFGFDYWINPGTSTKMPVVFWRLPGTGKLGPLVVEVSLSGGPEMDTQADAVSMPQEHRRVMKTPCDSWMLEDESLPRFYIMVERRHLDGGTSEAVDVVDLFIYPKGGKANRAKKALTALVRRAKSAGSG